MCNYIRRRCRRNCLGSGELDPDVESVCLLVSALRLCISMLEGLSPSRNHGLELNYRITSNRYF